ncbi:MAG TPA: hypothetical protein VGR20_24145 [Acidimicrobiia bacterium]|jgi:hypothetical protein|nr:hypothetical protein [Acidimicrobiia bacterium]
MGQVKRQLVIWGAIAATTAVLPGLALAEQASPDFGGRHGRGHEQQGNTKLSVAGRAMSKAEKQAYGLEIRGRSGEKPTDAGGMVRFAQRGADGSEGLVGEITCLSKDEAGIVSVTGTIKRSGKRASKGDKKAPGTAESAAMSDDDGTALLDELAPFDADETAQLAADDPAPPGAPTAPSMPGAPGQDPNKKHDHSKHAGELAGKDFAFTIDVPGDPQHFSQPTIGDKGTLAACSGGGAPVEVTRGRFRANESTGDNTRGDHRRGDRRRGDRK